MQVLVTFNVRVRNTGMEPENVSPVYFTQCTTLFSCYVILTVKRLYGRKILANGTFKNVSLDTEFSMAASSASRIFLLPTCNRCGRSR